MTKRNDTFDKKERDSHSLKHGASRRGNRTTEYEIWVGIRKRVKNPNNKLYSYYGGRGITLHEAWEDFSTFLQDVGPRPSKEHTLDRVDNNLGYCPDNCRWATKAEQARNKRNNIWVEGEILKDWCNLLGFNYKTVHRWFKEGFTIEEVKSKGFRKWRLND